MEWANNARPKLNWHYTVLVILYQGYSMEPKGSLCDCIFFKQFTSYYNCSYYRHA